MPCAMACPQPEPHGSPTFLTPLSTHPTPFVDPGRPSGSSPNCRLRIGSWGANTIALCLTLFDEAVLSFGKCGLPYGLRGALRTLHLCRSALPRGFPHRCHTRYEWVVRPSSAGTPTRQEVPSEAWRTTAAQLSGTAARRHAPRPMRPRRALSRRRDRPAQRSGHRPTGVIVRSQ